MSRTRIRRRLRSVVAGAQGLVDKHWPWRVNPSPVFVLGNQKAGTTAIAVLLAKATGEPYAIDPCYHCQADAPLPLTEFVHRNKRWFTAGVIKENHFTFRFEELRRQFPEARFVFVIRDPRDNIRSILNRMRLPGDLPRLDGAHRDQAERSGWSWILEEHTGPDESQHYVDVLARRWSRAADAFLANRGEMILIRYEDFVQDKIARIEQLARGVGLTPFRDITGAVDVQYQPAGNSSVSWSSFFGPENLRRIVDCCADNMELCDYS